MRHWKDVLRSDLTAPDLVQAARACGLSLAAYMDQVYRQMDAENPCDDPAPDFEALARQVEQEAGR